MSSLVTRRNPDGPCNGKEQEEERGGKEKEEEEEEEEEEEKKKLERWKATQGREVMGR